MSVNIVTKQLKSYVFPLKVDLDNDGKHDRIYLRQQITTDNNVLRIN